MINDSLQKAREFEARYLPRLSKEELPRFHVTGEIGWINDPNGFSVYQNEYHLFFQYHPYDVKWGPMHWGHVKTTDFLHWERLPVALAPDEEYDKDGCFSGSAIELPDGRHLLMYTGVRNERRQDGKVEFFQTQCIAVGDGVNYEKHALNPVIDGSMVPEGADVHDFRDPKIRFEDGKYYAIVGNRPADGSGSVIQYESGDGFEWKFTSVVASCHNQFGKMWECPDLFRIDGKDVLLTSPQEMAAMGVEFHPGNSTLCLIGVYDKQRHHLLRENTQAIDYGTDFYAPQTLETPDGRRIMIAWMQSWEASGSKPFDLPFFGQMTLPRELSVRNGRLFQTPVRELERYRGMKISYKDVMIFGETNLQGISGRFIDMTVTVRPANKDSMYRYFKLNVAKDGERFTLIRFKPENNTIRVDKTHSGFPHDIVNIRTFPVRPKKGEIKLRIVMDRYSMELFVNDGEQAASFVLYTPVSASSITFGAEGTVLLDVEKYDLEI